MNTTQTINELPKVTLGSMQQAVVELTAWAKIARMKRAGIKPILYFKKYQKRPSWLIELCKEEGIEIKRSGFVEKGKAYLLDADWIKNERGLRKIRQQVVVPRRNRIFFKELEAKD